MSPLLLLLLLLLTGREVPTGYTREIPGVCYCCSY